jgi:hypothetical protein
MTDEIHSASDKGGLMSEVYGMEVVFA